MDCKINAIATIKGSLNTSATLKDGLSITAIIQDSTLAATATITTAQVQTTAILQQGLSAIATIINSGINSEPCPLILCIDGGDAFTTVYPAVNGLLNGGSA